MLAAKVMNLHGRTRLSHAFFLLQPHSQTQQSAKSPINSTCSRILHTTCSMKCPNEFNFHSKVKTITFCSI
ncbi:hypothetical protein Hanom_Chr07g00653341 [Helianthus anomalus]